MAYEFFKVSKVDGVGVVTLSKPPANTYDFEFMREFDRVIEEIRLDEEMKVVVITNEPPFFSAGADIAMLKKSTPGYKAMFCLHCQETLAEIERIPKVIIAAINGHCVGGGLEIALAMDLRFMASGKGKIGLPEAKLGVLPGTGGTQRLPRLIGKARALDMMITGETISAEKALEIGLVQRVFAPEELMPKTMEYAKALAKGASRAVGLIKVAVQEGLEMPISAGFALERELQNRLFITEDAQEGLAAFIEKREAVFKGR